MWKKMLISALALVIFVAGVGYINRIDILLYVVANRDRTETLPNRPVTWETGAAVISDQPNIVFILLDDVGINDTSLYGGGVIDTPNINQLAAKGALFTNGYAAHANCAPSRAALLTGRDAARTGYDSTPIVDGMGRMVAMIQNYDPNGRPETVYDSDADAQNPRFNDRGLPGSEITMAEILKEQGYRTLHIGKWHLGRQDGMWPEDQGFDESLMMASIMYQPEDHPDVVNARLEFSGIDQFLWARGQHAVMQEDRTWFHPDKYLTDYFTEHAELAIEANANRPFFLYLAHWGAHNPLQATKTDYEAVGDIQPHRKRVYAAMMRSLDRSIGRVMAKLEGEGIADNTIIVLTSDNGAPDYIGLDDVNAPYRGWKNTFFEGGLRVPMSITWPGEISAGSVIDAPIMHTDIMPTLVAAGGGSMPTDRPIDGRDLSPLWSGADQIARPDGAMHWGTADYRVVQAAGWKLQLNPGSGQTWLFNLSDDPTEQTNLADVHPEKVAELTKIIDRHWKGAAQLARSVVSSPVTIDKHLAEPMRDGDAFIYWPN